MGMPFQRRGNPIQIPVSATSGATPHPVTIPPNVTSFMFENSTPYDIRLEGYPQGADMGPGVQATTGWLVMARTSKGPFRTKNPVAMSAQVFATPGVPLTGAENFTGCFIELVYGDGD